MSAMSSESAATLLGWIRPLTLSAPPASPIAPAGGTPLGRRQLVRARRNGQLLPRQDATAVMGESRPLLARTLPYGHSDTRRHLGRPMPQAGQVTRAGAGGADEGTPIPTWELSGGPVDVEAGRARIKLPRLGNPTCPPTMSPISRRTPVPRWMSNLPRGHS